MSPAGRAVRSVDEYDIQLAIGNHGEKDSPHYGHPEKILKVCRERSSRIGACPDLGSRIRSGIDPIEGLKTLGDHLISLRVAGGETAG